MNKLKHGISALAASVVLCAGANSLLANTASHTSADSNLSLPLAYFHIKTGERRYHQPAISVDSMDSETTQNRWEHYRYQHAPKPISVYRNRVHQSEGDKPNEALNPEISRVVF